MKPDKNKNFIEIPIAVDSNTTTINNFRNKILWSLMVVGVSIVAEIGIVIFASWVSIIWMSLVNLILTQYFIRYLIIRERHFKKIKKRLEELEYMLPITEMWGIIEITETNPTICRYADGTKAMFIQLQRGGKVGKGNNYEYENSEIIAEAYRHISKLGMSYMHIDYMEETSNDKRMKSIFEQIEHTENKHLKRLLREKFSYIEQIMEQNYTTHDVYLFYSLDADNVFWGDIQEIVEIFMQANYISAKVLNKSDISTLTKNLMNMKDFSINQAIETIYRISNNKKRIKVIWTEKNGIREVENKTKEEIQEEKMNKKKKRVRVKRNKNKVKDVPNTIKTRDNKEVEEEKEIEMDIFE